VSDQSPERVSQSSLPVRDVWRVCVDEFGLLRAPLAFVFGMFALACAPPDVLDVADPQQRRLDDFEEVDGL